MSANSGATRLRPLCAGFLAALTVLTGACGTEPRPDVTGTWTLTSSRAGGSFACTIVATLTLEESEGSLTGTLAEEQVSCSDNGQPVAVEPTSHTIAGELSGRRISFTTQVPAGSGACAFEAFEGSATDAAMSGSLETRPVFCQGTFVQMQGIWEAAR